MSGAPEGGPRRALRRAPRARMAPSRLTVTIVLANLVGLVILLVGSFALTQYRDGLIEAKLEGVRAQAQIIADVLAQVAVDQESCRPIDALDLDEAGARGNLCSIALSERDVREVFNRVWDSFEGRVRIFNAPQTLDDPPIKDASLLLIEDLVLREDRIIPEALPPLASDRPRWRPPFDAWGEAIVDFLTGDYNREAARRSIEDELNAALKSSPFAEERGAASVRVDEEGDVVVSVSVPIRRVQAIYGFVTAETGGIDDLVARARLAILPFFGLAVAAAILSSFLLTAMIAQPIRQLAIASDRVREGIAAAGRARIPDFTRRKDEIGELSGALKAMTQAIYDRMETIEAFAADVSHELKNPLTSIRSAAETLAIAKTPEQRDKLVTLIQKDVARMDRLITDISNASRLDAELARERRAPVDLKRLLEDIVATYPRADDDDPAQIRVTLVTPLAPVMAVGNGSALGQVARNLIDNARSFSPAGGHVRVRLEAPIGERGAARLIVEDDGPGVPAESLEKIFERFYTKRPEGASFGKNSGLGLAISRQIVSAHGGRIYAQNRDRAGGGDAPAIAGARFIVELPAI